MIVVRASTVRAAKIESQAVDASARSTERCASGVVARRAATESVHDHDDGVGRAIARQASTQLECTDDLVLEARLPALPLWNPGWEQVMAKKRAEGPEVTPPAHESLGLSALTAGA